MTILVFCVMLLIVLSAYFTRKKMFLFFQAFKSKSCLSTWKHLKKRYKAWKDRKKVIDTISYKTMKAFQKCVMVLVQFLCKHSFK